MKHPLSRLWFRSNQAGWNPHLFEWYFTRTPIGRSFRAREEEVVFGFLGAVLKSHHSVLEIGSGTGNYTVPVASRCAKVVAVDSSLEMLRYLQERCRRAGLDNLDLRLGHLPGGLGVSERFDGVLAVGVLNYVEPLEESLHTLSAILKAGGWAVFNVPVSTLEGRVHALEEVLLHGRRINILSIEEMSGLTERVGLKVQATAAAGLSKGGMTCFLLATSPVIA
ncbi:MAG: class I SAM-dependent methyltransferase [Actinomycetota bacterium]|nr:class I SAM-dependent methyltransferase [Actinomycetota bacterium]